MNNEILDDFDLIKTEKEGNLFPFILLVLSFCSLPFFQPFYLVRFIGVGFLLGINGVLILFNRKIGIIFTGMLCIFASINLINFFPFEMLAFGLSNTLAFDYISTPIFLGSYVLSNEEIFMDFRNKLAANRNKNHIKSSNQSYFAINFAYKSIQELEAIIENPSIVPDAKKAAIKLLKDKRP